MGTGSGNVSWQNAVFQILAGTPTHPLELAKFLIQVGHEPLAPVATKTIFGRATLALPNVFQYLRHVQKVDGLAGCYRGLALRLISQSVCACAYHWTSEVLKAHEIYHNENNKPTKKAQPARENADDGEEDSKEEDKEGIYDAELPMSERRVRFLRQLGCKITCCTVAIVISQPFHVAALRAMAQFVGRETIYSGTMGAIVGVFRENGICGFWSGMTPRLLGEVSVITLSASLTFLVRSYVVKDKALANIVTAVMGFIASTVTYPFHVVASCMAIQGSTLKAALPRNMAATCKTWIQCWSCLCSEGQIMRGSCLLWRCYLGPQVVVKGRAISLKPFKKY